MTASAAVPFPEEAAWQPLSVGGAEMADATGDGTGGDLLDLAGAPGWWSADPAALYLRIELSASPEGEAGTWGFLVDTDGVLDDFERVVTVDGPDARIHVFENASGASGTHVADLRALAPGDLGSAASGEVRFGAEGGRSTLELQLSAADVASLLGLGPEDTFRLVPFSSVYWPLGLADLAACDETLSPCALLADVLSDPLQLDADLDGLSPPFEATLGTDPEDGDSDDDGILDGEEAGDADADGTPDARECDMDSDGLADGTEIGRTVGTPDTRANRCFVADADPLSTTDPLVADTDGGGLPDGREDADHDGAVDPWETDPTDPSDDTDSDGDGVPDLLDDLFGAGADDDSDSDGIPDADEALGDLDSDGLPDFADPDSDADGIPDGVEGVSDTDNDGLADLRDTDSDADGIPDSVEGAGDADNDGTPDFRDLDSDDDGILDEDEGTVDTDSDGLADRVDPDSDNDGLLDEQEEPFDADTDGDGIFDRHDEDSDNDGHPDAIEGVLDLLSRPVDTDRDGTPDFRDLDSDDDGILDESESDTLDADCDGTPDRVDGDPEDGFCDTGTSTPGEVLRPPPKTAPPGGDPLSAPGDFTGGSCATAPRGAPWGLAWGAGLLALLRRRRGALLCLIPTAAAAGELDVQRLRPATDGGPFAGIEALDGGEQAYGLGLLVDYADDPLVYRPLDGEEVDVLGAVATAHLLGWRALGPLRLGAELPVHLFAEGYRTRGEARLGDARVVAKAKLLEAGPILAGPYLDLSLPTGSPSAYLGAGRARLGAGGLLAARAGHLTAAARIGACTGTGRSLGELSVSEQIRWGLGGALAVTDAIDLAAELDAERWLGSAGQPGGSPAEGRLLLQQRTDRFAVLLGLGTGLSRGVGAPDLRLLGGLRWTKG